MYMYGSRAFIGPENGTLGKALFWNVADPDTIIDTTYGRLSRAMNDP